MPDSDAPVDDRSTRARIRDAAIVTIARDGVAATTARAIAEAAQVSPGSVIHHFGSMEALRRACDEHVAATIRRRKQQAVAQGLGLDLVGALRDTGEDFAPLLAYLAEVLTEPSPAVAALVDELVTDAVGYMEHGVDSGMVRRSAQPRERAALLMIWSLGALVLHRHVHRLLGVDLTDQAPGDADGLARYAAPVWEILADGIFTEAFARKTRDALASPQEQEPHDDR